MKILEIIFQQVGKGTYRRAWNFGQVLTELGHEVTLIATSPKNRFRRKVVYKNGMQIIEMPDIFSGSLRSGWDPWNVLNRLNWVSGKRFDIVHAYESRPVVIYPALLVRQAGARLIMDWADWFGRGGSVEERSNPLIRSFLRPVETYFENHFRPLAQAHTVISLTLKQRAVGLGIAQERITLIPDGSNPEFFPQISPERARENIGLQATGIYFGYVGSIFKRDADLLSSTFDKIADKIPQSYLIVVGYCNYDIRKLVRHADKVIQTGPLNYQDLVSYLLACDIFLLTLRESNANRGRWPSKLNDYLAAGRPVVATAVGDVVPLFQEFNLGGMTLDQPDLLARQAIELALPEMMGEREKIGEQARILAETRFSWKYLGRLVEEVFLKALEQKD